MIDDVDVGVDDDDDDDGDVVQAAAICTVITNIIIT